MFNKLRLLFLITYLAVVCWFAYGTIQTVYWVETGHCCGSPFFVGTDWDDCLPVSDTPEFKTWLTKGHCNSNWKRVYP